MALGGGHWTGQNKILPGSYVNYASAKKNKDNAGERGTVAVAMEMDWGEANKVIALDLDTFYNSSLELFGYKYNDPKLLSLREAFKKAKKVLLYRPTNGGAKASNNYAEARYEGVRGNDLKIAVYAYPDMEGKKEVVTYLDNLKVDRQIVTSASELKPNRFVTWKSMELLKETAGEPLTNGANGSKITGTEHQAFLNALESYTFNALACNSTELETKKLYVEFTERLRAEIGKNFQVVVHNYKEADSYSVISVKNNKDTALVNWVAGAVASAPLNESLTNTVYNGELEVDTDYTQTELEFAIKDGEFALHKCEDEVRVLEDINTLVTYTDTVDKDFSNNQTVRILDYISARYVHVFNTYFLGKMPNDTDGRLALWNRLLDETKAIANIRAIEAIADEDVVVAKGKDKLSVAIEARVTPIGAMEKAYALIMSE